MKSNIKKTGTIKRNDPNKIMLSVGMIVKNEEKHLDNCLSALKKLLDAIPSELIIVDTGSTDRTKEIAFKYTDKVYDFEWIDDFAAARNCGLKKAKGEWFMYIDADEYLDEDCEEMIQFFTMPEVNQQYNSASIMIKNYSGKKDNDVSNTFLAPRLVRLDKDVEFKDPIHEYMPQPNPHGCFSTIFHHYGYVFESKKDKDKKADRTVLPLLEEYKKNPRDLRILAHLCDATHYEKYFHTFEEKERYYLEYLEEARKTPNTGYSPVAYNKAAKFYDMSEKYEKAIDVSDEYLKLETSKNSAMTLSIYFYKLIAYINTNKHEEVLETVEKYFEYYDRFKNNDLELAEMRYEALDGLTEYCHDYATINAARSASKLDEYDRALEILNGMNFKKMNFHHLRSLLKDIRELIRKTKKYQHAAVFYDKIQELGDDDKTGLILFLMEQYYLEHPYEREEFADAMIESGVKGNFIDLMKIVKADFEEKDISGKLEKFLDGITRWNDGYSEAIYLAMKHNVNISTAVRKMSNDLMTQNLQYISDAHIDYPKFVLDYCANVDMESNIMDMLFMTKMFECGVEHSKELYPDERKIYFDTFICTLSDYIFNIYNPDLLNPDDADVLPELHRFGYYMTLAFTAQKEGDLITYVRMLKEALRLCEPMKDVVAFYLSELEETMK